MSMALHAVDEDEIADGPAERPDRVFFHGAVVEAQRDYGANASGARPRPGTFFPYRHIQRLPALG